MSRTTPLDEVQTRLARIASNEPLASLLDADIARAIGDAEVVRARLEIIRFPGRSSKVLTSVRLATFPTIDAAPFEAQGFTVQQSARSVSMRRDDEWLLVERTSKLIIAEHSCEYGDISAAQAAAALAAIEPLACFAPLAAGNAALKSWGLARDRDKGLLGLVAVHRDLDRGDEDDRAMLEAGFREAADGALWATADGARSLVWMGGTVYGYLGPVPEGTIGDWV